MFLRLEGFEEFQGFERIDVQMRKAGYSVGGKVVLVDGDNGKAVMTKLSSLTMSIPWSKDRLSIGFSAKFSLRGSLFAINDINFLIDRLTGTPVFAGQKGGARPIRNKWYYYETIIDKAAGTVDFFINGSHQGTGKIPDGMNTSVVRLKLNDYSSKFTMENLSDYWTEEDIKKYEETQKALPRDEQGDNSVRIFDNLYVKEGEPCGPVSITTRRPDMTVLNEWRIESTDGKYNDAAALLGATSPDELEHYMLINKDGKRFSLKSSREIQDANGKVVAVGMVALVRKTNREDASILFNIGNESQEVTDIPFDWGYRYAGWDAKEGTSAADVKNSEFGLTAKIRSV